MPTDLTLRAGEIAVLSGLNGTGKTTLLLCLSGLLRPTTGSVMIDGHDLYKEEKEAKRQLAFVPDVPRFYTELTAWEHLYFIAQAHQAGEGFNQRAETLMHEFGLWDSRQIAQKLSFWLTLIGYNPRDRSLSHRIYLVYATIFMSLWGFAMLLFAASATAIVLTMLGIRSADQVAAQVSLFILVIWFLYQFWQVSRRSPFLFSEEDAYLICQTPVRRSFVAISWFAGDWFTQAPPIWALGATFGFAMIETQLGGNVPFSDLFPYIASGLRALSVFFSLHLGLLAVLWALGALRLQGDQEWRWMPRFALIVTLFVISSLGLWIVKPEFGGLIAPLGQAIAWPLRYSLQAAFSLHAWASGMVLASGIAAVGLVALVIAGEGLNLSRAAQESTQREKLQTAQRYGMVDLAREMKQRDRLGIGRSPAHLLARPGLWVLPWKDILQSRYEIGFGEIRNWLVLLGISSGLLLAPDFGSRLFLLAFWIFTLGQRTTICFFTPNLFA
jgi:ABC-type Fe3+/spermidine/putrescine transport system ATPase subunit